ncbi:hypothetical protein CISIN_1g038383mg, partial [Citrus sinensis]
KNLIENFTAATNKNYDQKQHRIRWEIVKKESHIWDALVRVETWLGWNMERQKIEATKEWWEAKLQLTKQLHELCEAVKNNPRCSVQEVLNKLATLPGCQPMSPLFKLGIRLFTKKANRETFVALSELEYQLKWLKDQQDNI